MGQHRSKRRAVQFQGIPGGVASGSVPERVATSRSTPVGSKRRWCDLKSFVYTRVAWWTAITKSNLDFVYNRSLSDSVYTRSLPRFCLYQVISRFCLYQTVLSYSHQCPVGRRALGRPKHACRAIATALARRPSRSASPGRWRLLRLAGVSNIHHSEWLGLASYCSSFGQSGFYRDAGVWTLGARQQRVYYSRPLSNSFPSLSFRTSHLRPSRPS